MNKTALLDPDIVGLHQYQSDDGLSDASDSENKGAGEFANAINEMGMIEDVCFALQSTAEGRRAAPEMVTAVFLCQTLWG